MTLPEDDYAPFQFFMSSVWLLGEIEDKWQAGDGMIKVSLCLSTDVNTASFLVQWNDWRDYCMYLDYAQLN